MIYLDHNASARLRPEVARLMTELLEKPGNPSSPHRPGQALRAEIEKARERLAHLTGAQSEFITFTASATEANNLALKGMVEVEPELKPEAMFFLATEHLSVLETEKTAQKIRVFPSGLIDLEYLKTLLLEKKSPTLVSVAYANNETGVIQPVAEIGALCQKYGAFFHCDATQALGRIFVNMAQTGIDLLTCSAHKIGGPKGAGALVTSASARPVSIIKGGGQESGLRAGTENVAAIAGFGLAAELAGHEIEGWAEKQPLRDAFEKALVSNIPNIVIHGQKAPRLPNTVSASCPSQDSDLQLIKFDLHNVTVGTGSACSSGKSYKSHVLKAMAVPDDLIQSAIRISWGFDVSKQELNKCLEIWHKTSQPDSNLAVSFIE